MSVATTDVEAECNGEEEDERSPEIVELTETDVDGESLRDAMVADADEEA